MENEDYEKKFDDEETESIDEDNGDVSKEYDSSSDEESKADKFIRVGEARVNKVLKAIQSLEGLSNKGSYEYTEEQVAVMFDAIRENLDDVQKQFTKKKTSFSFTGT